jgi:hypothetical protein
MPGTMRVSFLMASQVAEGKHAESDGDGDGTLGAARSLDGPIRKLVDTRRGSKCLDTDPGYCRDRD